MNREDIHEKINMKGAIEGWARVFVQKLQGELRKKSIRHTGALERSIARELLYNGGDVNAVLIKFNMYGRFIDMGVGRGVKAYERKTNKANLIAAKRYSADVHYTGRQPRRWLNKRKTAEIHRLREILTEEIIKGSLSNFKRAFESYSEYSLSL